MVWFLKKLVVFINVMRCLVSIFILFVFASCNSGNTYSAKSTTDDTARVMNTSRGKELFEEKCSACHGLNGDGMNNGAANLQVNKLDSIAIILTIQNGKRTMPPFKDAIADTDM